MPLNCRGMRCLSGRAQWCLRLLVLSVSALLLAFTGTQGLASTKTETACLKLDKQIVKYTKLRQSGGTAKQMDKWHRKRSAAKRRFSELRCK